jgi:hypothetical protein
VRRLSLGTTRWASTENNIPMAALSSGTAGSDAVPTTGRRKSRETPDRHIQGS